MHTKIFTPILVLMYMSECNVAVPRADKDEAPKISISSTDPKGKYGKNYKGDEQITVEAGTQLTFVESAFNDGGVLNTVLNISSPQQTLVKTSVRDAQGKVPKQLNNILTDGGQPIRAVFSIPGETYTVVATSENYNFMQSKMTLTFKVAFPAPKIDYLKFTKREPPAGHGEEDGYVELGQSATIIWNVLNCAPGCNITLTAQDQVGWTHTIFQATNLPASGSRVVTPTEQFTRYTLNVSNTSGSDTKEYAEQIHIPH